MGQVDEGQQPHLPPVEEDSMEEENQRVYVGFHPFGGIKVQADGVRLNAQEAFILAGQLTAHATMLLQQGYMEQAMAARMAQEMTNDKGIILPGK